MGIFINPIEKRIKNCCKVIFCLIILSLTFYNCGKSSITDKVPSEVLGNSLVTFDKLLNDKNFKDFGLVYKNQAKSLTSGIQYKRYFIGLSKIQNYNGTDSILQLLSREYSIEIPFKDSTNRTVTAIEYKRNSKNKWEPVAFGFSPIFSYFLNEELPNNVGEISIVNIPALNTGFYYHRDTTSGKLVSKILDSFNNQDTLSSKTYSDQEVLNILKVLSSKLDSRYPG